MIERGGRLISMGRDHLRYTACQSESGSSGIPSHSTCIPQQNANGRETKLCADRIPIREGGCWGGDDKREGWCVIAPTLPLPRGWFLVAQPLQLHFQNACLAFNLHNAVATNDMTWILVAGGWRIGWERT